MGIPVEATAGECATAVATAAVPPRPAFSGAAAEAFNSETPLAAGASCARSGG